MASRRGHSEGSIYFRESDHRWCAMVDLGWVNGKRKRKIIYGKTRKEVAEKLKIALREQQQGRLMPTERQTVAQFLTHWLSDVVKPPNTRPKTYRIYEQIVRTHLIPALGHLQLTKLTMQHVQAMLAAKQDSLSPRSVHHIRAVLRNALNYALRSELVTRNVAELTKPPKVEESEIRVLTFEEAKHFLDAARGDPLEALYRVALSLALREGEVLGLRWQDIDFDAKTLTVKVALQAIDGKLELVSPKTKRSRRTLPLPDVLITALRTHRARQLEAKLLAGSDWEETGLVFTTRRGTPLHPRNLLRSFYAFLQRAGLPKIRFHDLRHSCLSILEAQGVSDRVRMEIAGHSDIRLTQNRYTHVYDESKRKAIGVMDVLFGDNDAAKEVG